MFYYHGKVDKIKIYEQSYAYSFVPNVFSSLLLFFDLMYWLKILITANDFICIDIERLFAFFYLSVLVK